jgi:superfamily II DNA or RNA helicase
MRAAVLPDDADVSGLLQAVGAITYTRGMQYAKRRMVLQVDWDDQDRELHGVVQGRGGIYHTSAHFDADRPSPTFDHGSCSCPMQFDCKHVVALVLSAQGDRPARPQPERPVTWETSIGELLKSEPTDTPEAVTAHAPLAIQLSVQLQSTAEVTRNGGPGRPKLLAKLARPGKTGWINGSLSWSQLASSYYMNDLNRDHVRLMQEFYAVYRSRSSQTYFYGNDKTLDLSDFGSRNLWTLLDEAADVGIKLVHATKSHGEVLPYRDAELCLDVTRGLDSGSLVVRPVVRVRDGELVEPVLFIGADAHGLVYTDANETADPSDLARRPIQLGKLDKPASRQLQRMTLARARLEIPAAEAQRFRQQYYVRLRRMATVISSDGSFTPPEVSAPTLVLGAKYGSDHDLEFEFEWAYQVGDTSLRTPLGPAGPDAPYRDLDKEREVLAGLDLPLDELGLEAGGADERIITAGELTGIDTMRFTTELLPLIADQPGLVVEVTGSPADYREASDSVSIGVSTDAGDDPDWFDLGISITVEGREVPLADVIKALGRHDPYLLLPDGAYFSLDKPELQTLRRLIEEAQALQDAPGGLKISRYQAGLWEELAALGVVASQAAAWQQQVSGLLEIASVPPIEPPATLSAELRPYQHDGFHWLAFLWQHRLGGILADDMGLGKTLQALALICHAKAGDPNVEPFLVVAPTSVVPNWAAEAAKFAPGLKVAAISETRRRRGQTLAQATDGADVVVTSYTLFRLDFDDDYAPLPWSGLLLDEAQNVKNHQSKIYQAVRRLPAPFKLAITGTPMENNLMELWSQLSITAPGLFPSPIRFQDYYAKPIEKWHEADLLGQLRQRIKPLVKRRTKEQVASDLPEKQEQVLDLELHPKHRTVYDRHLQRERQKVLGLIDNMDENRFTILRSLTLLRQLSLHAGLVDDEHGGLPSAKIDALIEQLGDVVGGGHRALVFSQFTGFLGMVRDRLADEGIDYCYLDGKTRKRGSVIDEFKNGSAPVFLISLKAGGFGLNLTEADYCFLLDPWWNPATENQAVDRTHRIGQTRHVMVYRLIAKDTIEEKVMALKERKQELFDSVMDDGDAFGGSLTPDDIRGLFS